MPSSSARVIASITWSGAMVPLSVGSREDAPRADILPSVTLSRTLKMKTSHSSSFRVKPLSGRGPTVASGSFYEGS